MESHTTEAHRLSFSIRDAANAARCGRSKIYEEIKVGRLHARKLGRRTVILATDLSSWLSNLPLLKP